MNLSAYAHWNCFIFWPALTYLEARCSEPSCIAWHGFTIELGFLWWSVCLDIVPKRDEAK
jgi:hypothetical protein